MTCDRCGFAHETPRTAAEFARCENARAIGKKLATRLAVSAVPPACTDLHHKQVMHNEHSFLLNTRDWFASDNGRTLDLCGYCRVCGKFMSFHVRASDQRLAAAVESLKGDR